MQKRNAFVGEIKNFIWTQKKIESRRFLAFANLVWETFESESRVIPTIYCPTGTRYYPSISPGLDSEIAGILWVDVPITKGCVEIVNIYVSETYRSQKVGTYIINDVLAFATRMQRNVILSCAVDKVDYYHKFGFQICGGKKQYEELINMEWNKKQQTVEKNNKIHKI